MFSLTRVPDCRKWCGAPRQACPAAGPSVQLFGRHCV